MELRARAGRWSIGNRYLSFPEESEPRRGDHPVRGTLENPYPEGAFPPMATPKLVLTTLSAASLLAVTGCATLFNADTKP